MSYKSKILILILIVFPVAVNAAERPTRGELFAVWVGVRTIDLMQTLSISGRELNPIVGKPTVGRVIPYFISTTMINYLLIRTVPVEWGKRLLFFQIGASVSTVFWNYRAGIRIKF